MVNDSPSCGRLHSLQDHAEEKMTMTRYFVGALVAAGLAATPVLSDEIGQSEYMIACAGCHGESGKGDGPLAPLLNISTPGLTTLAARNDGVFPFAEVFLEVDGRGGIRAHGSSMPVWGERFSATALSDAYPDTAELIARGRVLSLVYYLQSIQE
jgi:mono/diheme cytochrome c family protein